MCYAWVMYWNNYICNVIDWIERFGRRPPAKKRTTLNRIENLFRKKKRRNGRHMPMWTHIDLTLLNFYRKIWNKNPWNSFWNVFDGLFIRCTKICQYECGDGKNTQFFPWRILFWAEKKTKWKAAIFNPFFFVQIHCNEYQAPEFQMKSNVFICADEWGMEKAWVSARNDMERNKSFEQTTNFCEKRFHWKCDAWFHFFLIPFFLFLQKNNKSKQKWRKQSFSTTNLWYGKINSNLWNKIRGKQNVIHIYFIIKSHLNCHATVTFR